MDACTTTRRDGGGGGGKCGRKRNAETSGNTVEGEINAGTGKYILKDERVDAQVAKVVIVGGEGGVLGEWRIEERKTSGK